MKAVTIILSVLLTNNLSVEPVSHWESRQKIFKLINTFRKENGLQPLEYVKIRQFEVDLWAIHLERSFEHAGSRYTCENIAMNYESPVQFFYQWKDSPPHRKNMLLKSIKYCAIGIHEGKNQDDNSAYYGVFRGYAEKLRAR